MVKVIRFRESLTIGRMNPTADTGFLVRRTNVPEVEAGKVVLKI